MTEALDYKYIKDYMAQVEAEGYPSCKRLRKAMPYIREKLSNPDVYCDIEKTERAIEIIGRYFYEFLDWQLFVLALIHCYYKSNDTVVFDEILLLMGTGSGKNGFISALVWYLTTEDHGVEDYNVEIIANSEQQAMTSFNDVYNMLDSDEYKGIMNRLFYKTKELIRSRRTGSEIRYNTSNARTRLGKRAGCLVFDEILEYENWTVFNAFNASFGKVKHSRKLFITTNGYVRGGFLDDMLDMADMVLDGEVKTIGLLPLIFELDDKEEAHDPKMWKKANPSIDHPNFSTQKAEIANAYEKMKLQPQLAIDFLTKRMNLPAEDAYLVVAEWEQILKTNKPIPYDELKGMSCVGAFDFAQIHDFASCGLLFKYGGKRYWIEHSFVCKKSLRMESREIKFPVEEMAERGLLTIVNRDSITPQDISGWFLEQAKKYHIETIVGDLFRLSLLQAEFSKHGLPLESVRSGPYTHALVAPLIDDAFGQETLVFGDNPVMRWYVNNTYRELDDKGNTTYLKVEPKTRKTDGFFALIHALVKDDLLEDIQEYSGEIWTPGVYTY